MSPFLPYSRYSCDTQPLSCPPLLHLESLLFFIFSLILDLSSSSHLALPTPLSHFFFQFLTFSPSLLHIHPFFLLFLIFYSLYSSSFPLSTSFYLFLLFLLPHHPPFFHPFFLPSFRPILPLTPLLPHTSSPPPLHSLSLLLPFPLLLFLPHFPLLLPPHPSSSLPSFLPSRQPPRTALPSGCHRR